ncbi:MAG: hypothetical protein MJK18_11035 [Bdellovibrionales bacterium]|nr:hypothetical protein [Bdellovibrionales bacterium]
MLQQNSYEKIVSGFKKTITECEKLILQNANEEKKLDQKLKDLASIQYETNSKKKLLKEENRKAGALASKLMDLIEE